MGDFTPIPITPEAWSREGQTSEAWSREAITPETWWSGHDPIDTEFDPGRCLVMGFF